MRRCRGRRSGRRRRSQVRRWGCYRRRRRRSRARRRSSCRGWRRRRRAWRRSRSRRRWWGRSGMGRSGRRRRSRVRRSCPRRCSLRGLLRPRFAVGADFARGRCRLRHNQWRALRVGDGACHRQRRNGGGGKQHKTKVDHDEYGSRIVRMRTKNKQALGRIVAAFKCRFGFILRDIARESAIVHNAFRLLGNCYVAALYRLSSASVAGDGVVGLFGPRTGSSSGIRPGNSSGRGASPGSWIGGGTSGRGPAGGSSGGGSAGWPGVAGGISGGSIGIDIVIPAVVDATTTSIPRCSRAGREPPHAGAWQTASMLWPSGSSTKAP